MSREIVNQDVDDWELAKIRSLKNFDLLMLISEIHDFGWPRARATLAIMPPNPDHGRFKCIQELANECLERPHKKGD